MFDFLKRKPKPNIWGDVPFISAQEARDRMQTQFNINSLEVYNPHVIQLRISEATRNVKYSTTLDIPQTELGQLLMPKEIMGLLIKKGYSVRISDASFYYIISWEPTTEPF